MKSNIFPTSTLDFDKSCLNKEQRSHKKILNNHCPFVDREWFPLWCWNSVFWLAFLERKHIFLLPFFVLHPDLCWYVGGTTKGRKWLWKSYVRRPGVKYTRGTVASAVCSSSRNKQSFWGGRFSWKKLKFFGRSRSCFASGNNQSNLRLKWMWATCAPEPLWMKTSLQHGQCFNYHRQFCWSQRYQIIQFLCPQIHADTSTVCIMWISFFFPVFFLMVLTLLLPKGEKIRKDHYASLGNYPPTLLLSQHKHLLLT